MESLLRLAREQYEYTKHDCEGFPPSQVRRRRYQCPRYQSTPYHSQRPRRGRHRCQSRLPQRRVFTAASQSVTTTNGAGQRVPASWMSSMLAKLFSLSLIMQATVRTYISGAKFAKPFAHCQDKLASGVINFKRTLLLLPVSNVSDWPQFLRDLDKKKDLIGVPCLPEYEVFFKGQLPQNNEPPRAEGTLKEHVSFFLGAGHTRSY
jgi:hypothetical protein